MTSTPSSSSDRLAPTPSDPASPPPRRLRPLTAIKSTYALVYAVDGAILPFFTVFLAQEHGLDASQIGLVLAISAAAGIVGPPLVTMLADGFGRANRLLLGTLTLSAAALLAFCFAQGFWWLIVLFTVYGLAREPIRPLLDGIFFAARRTSDELAAARFHQVRIWGSAGFMVPGVLLYFLIGWQGDSLALLPVVGCVLAFATLPLVRHLPAAPPRTPESPSTRTKLGDTARAAYLVLVRPNMAIFVLAMFLLQAGMAAYMAFYPLQAAEVGVSSRWLGLLTTLGVGFELGFMAAFGWFVKTLGWRWFMVVGSATAVVRMVALAVVPGVASVIGTQVIHGMVIIVTMVGSRALLDREAPDGVRYTVQGIYAMVVMGGGRIVGNAVGGHLASVGLAQMFWTAAIVSAAATCMLAWSLRSERRYGAWHA
ncbi:MAG TPA: MFS transporter [Actinopolymorphaceae bacterium]